MKIIWLILLLLILSQTVLASEVETIYLKEAPRPEKSLFSTVTIIIEELEKEMQQIGSTSFTKTIDKDKGIIETNWYPVHKGEVSEKVQIFVWGNIYRVDVWHKSRIGIWRTPKKGYKARLVEMNLQSKIEKLLRN